jgi:protein O-mannosyl-transferase
MAQKKRKPQPSAVAAPRAAVSRSPVVVAIVLVALTLAVFAQLRSASFVNLDDENLVSGNEHVRGGLTAASVKWALTSAESGYYPLTWLSHMTDVQLFGMDAGDHHLVAVALHILSTLILFLALLRFTGAPLASGFAAALFAIHPLHVESVAWISERKDTLSTLFGFLAILAYLSRPRRMTVVALLMVASLLSKQMLVTLPLVLLLFDWWRDGELKPVRTRIVQKIPLFAISAAACAIAIVGQRNQSAMQSLTLQPFTQRAANALVAYVLYLGKLFVPVHLSVFYPLVHRTALQAIGSAILLAALTAGAWVVRKRAPYVLFGWLWYVVTLIPVIGLVQIGAQSIADRYTYIPAVGIFIAISWAAFDFLPKEIASVAAVAIIGSLAFVAHRQTSYWHDSPTLFAQAVEAVGPASFPDYLYGRSISESDPDRALPYLRRAIGQMEAEARSRPADKPSDLLREAQIAAGTALLLKAGQTGDKAAARGFIDEAERHYRAALTADPRDPLHRVRYDLAITRETRKRLDGRGDDAQSIMTDGATLLGNNRLAEAAAVFRRAVAESPDLPETHVYLGIALAGLEQNAAAVAELRAAQQLNEERANLCLTRALQLPFDENNLRNFMSAHTRR